MNKQKIHRGIRRFGFGLGALSFLIWILFSIITPFTNIFSNGYNLFNIIHTISLLTWVSAFVVKTLSTKQERNNFKEKFKDFFVDKKIKDNKTPVRKGCSSCKKKSESN